MYFFLKIQKSDGLYLQMVLAMSNDDPRKMEEIRRFSAIYGRFDCKRKPEKPLTLHEVTAQWSKFSALTSDLCFTGVGK